MRSGLSLDLGVKVLLEICARSKAKVGASEGYKGLFLSLAHPDPTRFDSAIKQNIKKKIRRHLFFTFYLSLRQAFLF